MNGELEIVKKEIETFVKERGWERYHRPKEIVLSLGAEVGELMREFQWIGEEEERELLAEGERRERVVDEMADIFFYLVDLARVLDVDLLKAFREKMKKNRKKYPAEVFRGVYRRP
ncbi:MAG: nucleotide pyrophosphohydrolase [Thermoplasmata archaeon]|nr:nucleotide pyrophosphohydrolase [Thermoplasmata archaeon]OYT47919.1 MAG: nucleotide pyrophosphohydrolase [Thermoplasmatales archaeon ex4484_36]HDD60636.1 nucleotide pyrophosphohydrolase [Euryarchaeota archaeon]RLF55574.1 MAG: nucleotide pyrophosphohydrolase [Thermoplasmata archaeon]RLF69811.1 MAG: nucleotide pyrophosphohydrolase [Thermoplasmata archaeon]